MPLSEHEQRLLDQIERALYAEDPKFASTVRGGRLRKPTRRRRLQGCGRIRRRPRAARRGRRRTPALVGLQLPGDLRRRLPGHARWRGRRGDLRRVQRPGRSSRPRARKRTRTASPAAWKSASGAASSRSSRLPRPPPSGQFRVAAVVLSATSWCRGIRLGRTERGNQPLPPGERAAGGDAGPTPCGPGRSARPGPDADRRTSSTRPPRPRSAAPAAPRDPAGARAPVGGPCRARCRSADRTTPRSADSASSSRQPASAASGPPATTDLEPPAPLPAPDRGRGPSAAAASPRPAAARATSRTRCRCRARRPGRRQRLGRQRRRRWTVLLQLPGPGVGRRASAPRPGRAHRGPPARTPG